MGSMMEMAGEETVEETRALEERLRGGRAEAELSLLFFSAALRSYKRDFLLKPFPAFALGEDGEKDWGRLEAAAKALPPLRSLRVGRLGGDGRRLLAWLLLDSPAFRLRLVTEAEERERVLGLSQGQPGPSPTHCFAFTPSPAAAADFAAAAGDHPRTFAYHGSPLHNFHSILHHGLISNLNKTAMFGEGTYLSPELAVSLNWSPLSGGGPGQGVGLGRGRFSAVALAEVALAPSGVRSGVSAPRADGGGPKSDVPERYMVVRNDSLVQIRYVLLYAEAGGGGGVGREAAGWERWAEWGRRRWALVLLVGYAALLLAASAASSGASWHRALRRVSALWPLAQEGQHRPPYDDA